VAAVAFWYLPASHSWQDARPWLPCEEPAGQGVHSVDAFKDANVPALHGRHKPDPFTALNVPTRHASHTPPSGPEYPTLHTQSVTLLLPGGDEDWLDGHRTHAAPPVRLRYVPPGHSEQSPAPSSALKNPASHAVQLSVPEKPLTHTQSWMLVLAAAEVALGGHMAHAVVPFLALYVPGRHGTHTSDAFPYNPAPQNSRYSETDDSFTVTCAVDITQRRNTPP
jgi:hypothetical protein